MDINYGVLMPPRRQSPRKLQIIILSGVGVIFLAAIVTLIVVVRTLSQEPVPAGPQMPTASTSLTPAPQAAVTPVPASAPAASATPAPSASTTKQEEAPAPKSKKKKVAKAVKKTKPAAGAEQPAAKPKKSTDDELKKLLGI